MSNSSSAKKTAAAEPKTEVVENATVPAQAEGTDNVVELTVSEGGKKSLKDRVSGVVGKVKNNKKSIGVTLAVVAAASVVALKLLKQRAEEVVTEVLETVDPEGDTTDESAA